MVTTITVPTISPRSSPPPQEGENLGWKLSSLERICEVALQVISFIGLVFAGGSAFLGLVRVISLGVAAICVGAGLLAALITWLFPYWSGLLRDKQIRPELVQAFKENIQQIIANAKKEDKEAETLKRIEQEYQTRFSQEKERVWEVIFKNKLITPEEMTLLYDGMMNSNTINMLSRINWFEKLEAGRKAAGALGNDYQFKLPAQFAEKWQEETKDLHFISLKKITENGKEKFEKSIFTTYGIKTTLKNSENSFEFRFNYLSSYGILNQVEVDSLEGFAKDVCTAQQAQDSPEYEENLKKTVEEVNFRYRIFRESKYSST